MGSSHSSAGYDEVASKKESADEWGAKTSISLTDTGLIIYERLELRKKWWNRENGRLTHIFFDNGETLQSPSFLFFVSASDEAKDFFSLGPKLCGYLLQLLLFMGWATAAQNFALVRLRRRSSYNSLHKKLLMGSHQLGDSAGPG